MDELKENYNFFRNSLDTLLQKYQGKFLSIKNKSIIGVYDSFDEAYTATLKTEKLGTFIIQQCETSEKTTCHFALNNVVFA